MRVEPKLNRKKHQSSQTIPITINIDLRASNISFYTNPKVSFLHLCCTSREQLLKFRQFLNNVLHQLAQHDTDRHHHLQHNGGHSSVNNCATASGPSAQHLFLGKLPRDQSTLRVYKVSLQQIAVS